MVSASMHYMKSIFRYPGGKAKAAKKIFSYIPSTINEYRETMVGGGSVFFHLRDELPNVKCWINDVDENLISVYQALRDRGDDFIKMCKEIAPAQPDEPLVPAKRATGRAIHNARLKAKFDELAVDSESDPALRYFFINRTVWAGRVNYDSVSRLYFSKSVGWNIVKGDKLEQANRLCQDIKITTGDFEPLLWESGESDDEVLCYVDPPYVVNSLFTDNSKLYANNFTVDDHYRLADAIRHSSHKVIISYDDDDDGLVRRLYKDFNIHEESWAYCGSTLKTKKIGKELIITNY